MGEILVVGSLNMDFVIEVNKMPKEGETILGKSLTTVPGGKGANQAFAIGKLGGNVSMIGAVGKDIYGETLINNLNSVKVNTEGIYRSEIYNTGNAFITVNDKGENSITVISGSNNCVNRDLIKEYEYLIDRCEIVVMQLEIPMEVVEYVASIAKEKGKRVILDPAPAPKELSESLLKNTDIIKPNEVELSELTGMKTDTIDDVILAARSLIKKGANTVIVTMGERGSVIVSSDEYHFFESEKVLAVDTTAAGDSFIAAFSLALNNGKNIKEAVEFGNKVSSIVVTRKGAQTSIPSKDEVLKIYRDNGGNRNE